MAKINYPLRAQASDTSRFTIKLVTCGSHALDPNGKPYGENRGGDAWPLTKSAESAASNILKDILAAFNATGQVPPRPQRIKALAPPVDPSSGLSTVEAALLGAGATAALPAASTLQYAAYDLPKYLRQADKLSETLPIVSSTNSPAVEALRSPGRVVLQAADTTRLRDVLTEYRSRMKESPVDGSTSERLRHRANQAKGAWLDTFEPGYGATATSGSPFRHAAITDEGGRMLDAHASTPGGRKAQLEFDKKVAEQMQSVKNQVAHSKNFKTGAGGNNAWVARGDVKPAFSLAGDFDMVNKEKSMASAFTNSASNYDFKGAIKLGLRHIFAPRLPEGKADPGKVVCRGNWCSRQAEDAFGLKNLFGGKDALPAHLTIRSDFKPKAIVTRNISGSAAEQVSQLKALWRAGIKNNARRRLGLGAIATAAAAVPGLIAGGIAGASGD